MHAHLCAGNWKRRWRQRHDPSFHFRPCPLTVVQETVPASWQVRFDRSGCWLEAWLGLLAALARNSTCPLGTVCLGATCSCQLGPIRSVPLACCLCFLLFVCMCEFSSLWLCFILHMQVLPNAAGMLTDYVFGLTLNHTLVGT